MVHKRIGLGGILKFKFPDMCQRSSLLARKLWDSHNETTRELPCVTNTERAAAGPYISAAA
jgi:hypothetical protein